MATSLISDYPVQSAMGFPLVGNVKTLAAAGGGSESLNLFQIVGTVLIKALWLEVTTVLSAGPLASAFFEAWDGTVSTNLTLNNGVISSLPVGSVLAKSDVAAVTMTIMNPTAGMVAEHAVDQAITKEFLMAQKTATSTYIRLTYANGGGGAATGGVRPFIIWLPRTSGSYVATV